MDKACELCSHFQDRPGRTIGICRFTFYGKYPWWFWNKVTNRGLPVKRTDGMHCDAFMATVESKGRVTDGQ